MAARRCDMGCESWPDEPIFATCSHCGEPTRRISNGEPTITVEEAKVLKLYDLFDRFYERRCERLGIKADGPLSDADALVVGLE